MLRQVARARLYLLFCEHKKEIEAEEVSQEETALEDQMNKAQVRMKLTGK
jgi:hypothetical protein